MTTDRRQAPRRSDETALHYARENLLAKALSVVDVHERFSDFGPERLVAHDSLRAAAAMYRKAEADHLAAERERND